MHDVDTKIINWLLSGDPSIVYQTNRDLLNADATELSSLQKNIEENGWAKKFLTLQENSGMWGGGLYSPK